MLNNWCGQGRLTKDIELRYTQGGTAVASFTLACERDYKQQDGKRETDWIDVVAWKNSAEFVEKFFKKGDMMIVSGRIQTRTYEDSEGKKRKVVEVVGTSFNFGGSKRQDGEQKHSEGQYSTQGQYGTYNQIQQSTATPNNNPYSQMQQNTPPASSNPYGQNYGGNNGNKYGDFMSIPEGIDEELPFA